MGGKPVDLYKLKKLVAASGGAESVSENKEWSGIGNEIGLGYSYGGNLRLIYQKWIMPYENYISVRRKKDPSLPNSPTDEDLDMGIPTVDGDGESKEARPRRASAGERSKRKLPMRSSMQKSLSKQALPEGYIPSPGKEVCDCFDLIVPAV
jgi:hypothetical protein